MKGVVVGGTASGVGKTVTTLAVARALADEGYSPVPAKAGPDYIDPSHHAAAIGRPSRTLDTWMQGVDGVRRNLHRAVEDFDSDGATLEPAAGAMSGFGPATGANGEHVAVVEGMMGLYDGSVTSTAATAAALDLPVVLVVDASAGMQSVGATALGFREYAAHVALPAGIHEAVDEPRIDVVGVVAARAHGGRHASGIRDSLPDGIAWFGRTPPMDDLEIPDRHLGLHMGEEAPLPESAIAEAATTIDGESIGRVARRVPDPSGAEGKRSTGATRRHDVDDRRPTVAVASDVAFRFIYPATRDRLSELADVVPFAPVAGDDLPKCDAVYLPGGYPENHADELAASPALATLRSRAADGLPILGECGGLMALVESLTTIDGETHGMAGVLPGDVVMRDRYQALDHVELLATQDGVTAAAGERHRGHEFHYSEHALGRRGNGAGDSADGDIGSVDAAVDPDVDARFAFSVERGKGIDGERDGLREYSTVGTYAHRHAASGAFDRLVESAREYAGGS